MISMSIRATCETCGDLELTAEDLRLRMCIETNQGEFRFTCPQCTKVTAKEITGPTFDLLTSAGVSCYEWHLPKELFETKSGPKISHDDVIEFHDALTDQDRFTEALDSLTA